MNSSLKRIQLELLKRVLHFYGLRIPVRGMFPLSGVVHYTSISVSLSNFTRHTYSSKQSYASKCNYSDTRFAIKKNRHQWSW